MSHNNARPDPAHGSEKHATDALKGYFDDADRAYVITDPVTPRPWINYLGNRRLRAFVSQNAGGLLWHHEPYSRRITRYHYTAPPGDRPGFYLYVLDRATGQLWNPHYAPCCAPLDRFECRHRPGITSFTAVKDGIEVGYTLGIPPDDDVWIGHATVRNTRKDTADVLITGFLEFGLLEFMREAVGWCYLQHQFSLHRDIPTGVIHYDYHVFEAPYAPVMRIGCSDPLSGWECSRDRFIGRNGSYAEPAAIRAGLGHGDLPLGGHACAAQAVALHLDPGQSHALAWGFSLDDDADAADAALARYRRADDAAAGLDRIDAFWMQRFHAIRVDTGDAMVDRMVNIWLPYNSMVALDLARTLSTDHMGTDGLRYRDTTQDGLAVAALDPEFAWFRLCQVLARQREDGGGCFAFFPDDRRPVSDIPRRSDNTVWPVFTLYNLIAETGRTDGLDEEIPYRDGRTSGTVYDHVLRGLRHIWDRRGPHGLPTLFQADWNDSLILFGDEAAESVMLGMQLVYACRLFRELADARHLADDAGWCERVITELTAILNSDAVWDGRWYRRLLLSNGTFLGGQSCAQGRIYLNPQSWSVISGVGDYRGRGRQAMDAVAERLDSKIGLLILAPPYTGIPGPEDPLLGSHPGVGENGGIFCHANPWAVIAECLLGNGNRAWTYFRQMLPAVVSERVGTERYQREPYALVSSIVGPSSNRFGEGGISWLTGTANWMHVAATHYLLGIRPTLDGLRIQPCLPDAIPSATVWRQFRGRTQRLDLKHPDIACS